MRALHLPALVRSFRRRRSVQVAVAASSGIAIAVTTVAITLLDRLTLSPLPAQVSPRVVAVLEQRSAGQTEFFTYETFSRIVSRGDLPFANVAAIGYEQATVVSPSGSTRTSVGFVSASYFRLLTVQPARGRLFTEHDHDPGAVPVAVISYQFWERMLSADPAIVGRSLRLGSALVTIVGIVAPDFRGTRLTTPPGIYIPLQQCEALSLSSVNYLGRVGTGEAPLRWLTVWAELPVENALRSSSSAPVAGFDDDVLVVMRASDAVIPIGTRADATSFTTIVCIASLALVIIATATSAMWILLDIERRLHELTIGLALGASMRRLKVAALTEAALPHTAGAILSFPFGALLLSAVGQVAFDNISVAEMITLRPTLRGVLAGVCVFATSTAVAALLVSAVAHRATAAGVLGHSIRERSHGFRCRRGLVAAQVASAICLLAIAVAFNRSLDAAFDIRLDYSPELLESASFDFAELGYSKSAAAELLGSISQRLRVDRTVSEVAVRAYAGGVTTRGTVFIDAQPVTPSMPVSFLAVEPSYFDAYGATIMRGRGISPSDTYGAPRVAVISESLAHSLGADGIIGRHVTVNQRSVEIIGISSDIVLNLRARRRHMIYLAYAQHQDWLGMNRGIVVRGTRPGSALRALRAQLAAHDPALGASIASSAGDSLRQQVAVQQFGGRVIGLLASFTVTLALGGAYVLASSVALLKRRELALRYALGATQRSLAANLVRYMAFPIAVGVLLGGAAYYWTAAIIQSSLYGVSAADPMNVLPASLLFGVICISIAAYAVRSVFHTEEVVRLLQD